MISDTAMRIIREGKARVRVKRSGMLQQQIFVIKRVQAGQETFVELFLNKVIDMSELTRIANELDLPIEAENGRAFPSGKGAKDYLNL